MKIDKKVIVLGIFLSAFQIDAMENFNPAKFQARHIQNLTERANSYNGNIHREWMNLPVEQQKIYYQQNQGGYQEDFDAHDEQFFPVPSRLYVHPHVELSTAAYAIFLISCSTTVIAAGTGNEKMLLHGMQAALATSICAKMARMTEIRNVVDQYDRSLAILRYLQKKNN